LNLLICSDESQSTEAPKAAEALPRLPMSALQHKNGIATHEDESTAEPDAEELALLQNAGSEDASDIELDLLQDSAEKEGQTASVHLIKARLATAVKALGNWKSLGMQLTGKPRSEVYEQFVQDVCEYYGYNQFLAEMLIELFPIDEVGFIS